MNQSDHEPALAPIRRYRTHGGRVAHLARETGKTTTVALCGAEVWTTAHTPEDTPMCGKCVKANPTTCGCDYGGRCTVDHVTGERVSESDFGEQVECPGCGNYVSVTNGALHDHFVNEALNGVIDGRYQPPAYGGWHLCAGSNRQVTEPELPPQRCSCPDGPGPNHLAWREGCSREPELPHKEATGRGVEIPSATAGPIPESPLAASKREHYYQHLFAETTIYSQRVTFLLGELVRFANEGIECRCPTGDMADCEYCCVMQEAEEVTRYEK